MSHICPAGEGAVPSGHFPSPRHLGSPLPAGRPAARSSLGQAAGGQCPLVPEGLWTRKGCEVLRRSLPCHGRASAEDKTKGP